MRLAKSLEPHLKRLVLRTLAQRGNTLIEPVDASSVSRVLIYRPQRFGDMLATLPILRALRKACPAWHLALWTSAQGRELIQPEAVVDEIRLLSGRTYDRLRSDRSPMFDLVIDLVPHDSVNALLACASAARGGILAGFGKDAFSAYYDWARPYSSPDLYAPLAGLGVLKLLGVPPRDAEFGLHYLRSETAFAAQTLGRDGRAIAINLSARHAWPALHWGPLLDHLAERFDAPVLINAVGRDRGAAVELARTRSRRVRLLPEKATFREVACLVSQVMLLVSPDTSLIHVAAAAGVPTVGLFPKRHDFRLCWIPPGDHVRIVSASLPDTLSDISAGQVGLAVDALFAAQPAGSGSGP